MRVLAESPQKEGRESRRRRRVLGLGTVSPFVRVLSPARFIPLLYVGSIIVYLLTIAPFIAAGSLLNSS